MNRIQEEINHFSKLEHIWCGQMTEAGQRRYDDRGKLFRQYCKPQIGYKILEIGCGDGQFTKELKGRGFKIIATDVTPKVLERARKKVSFDGLAYQLQNCERLTFHNSRFDVVCGISVLHHVDLEKTLGEAYRVLKRGGKIFFTEPNLMNPFVFATANIGWLRKRMEYSPSEQPVYRLSVERLLREVGFRRIIVKNYDFLFPWIPNSLMLPLEKLGGVLERIPVVKEVSGSLLISASK